MPLDSHTHLSRLGWAGKGKPLKEGGITRPLHVNQKKNLSGVGKDRDEAFPFWDHVFTAAAKSIVIKVPGGASSGSDSDSDSDSSPTPAATPLARTSTGILSNRRPTLGTPALSGTSTPNAGASGTQTPDGNVHGGKGGRVSLLALAKQQAARSQLYARFFRGPVLRMGDEDDAEKETESRGVQVEMREEAGKVGDVEEVIVEETVSMEVVRKKKRKRDAAATGGDGEVHVRKKKKSKLATSVSEPSTTAAPAEAAPVPSEPTEPSKGERKKRKRPSEGLVDELDEKERKAEKKRRKKEREERRAAQAAKKATVAEAVETAGSSTTSSITAVDESLEPVVRDGKAEKKEKKKKKRKSQAAALE